MWLHLTSPCTYDTYVCRYLATTSEVLRTLCMYAVAPSTPYGYHDQLKQLCRAWMTSLRDDDQYCYRSFISI